MIDFRKNAPHIAGIGGSVLLAAVSVIRDRMGASAGEVRAELTLSLVTYGVYAIWRARQPGSNRWLWNAQGALALVLSALAASGKLTPGAEARAELAAQDTPAGVSLAAGGGIAALMDRMQLTSDALVSSPQAFLSALEAIVKAEAALGRSPFVSRVDEGVVDDLVTAARRIPGNTRILDLNLKTLAGAYLNDGGTLTLFKLEPPVGFYASVKGDGAEQPPLATGMLVRAPTGEIAVSALDWTTRLAPELAPSGRVRLMTTSPGFGQVMAQALSERGITSEIIARQPRLASKSAVKECPECSAKVA